MKRTGALLKTFAMALFCCTFSQSLAAQAERWDYVRNPVRVSEVSPPKGQIFDTVWPPSLAAMAFDGFGSQGINPAAVRGWRLPNIPTPGTPAICEIDYGKPVAVAAFVHYFYVPGSRDLRFLSPAPSAFRHVRILSRQDDRTQWKLATTLSDLPQDCPQVLPVRGTEAARYWRLEILELAARAEMLMSYEIETYTGDVPHIVPMKFETPDDAAAFANHVRAHQPSIGPVRGSLVLAENSQNLDVQLQNKGQSSHAELVVVVDNQPASLIPSGKSRWSARLRDGRISIQSEDTPMGALLDLTYAADQGKPIK